MNTSSSLRLGASLLATLLVLMCAWLVFGGVQRVQIANRDISKLQNNENSQANIAPEQWLIHAGSHGAAGAALQARLRASARSADVSLTRVEIQPPDGVNTAQVRASAQVSGTPRAIANFIYQLENKAPALILSRARISKDDNNGLDVDLLLLARTKIQVPS